MSLWLLPGLPAAGAATVLLWTWLVSRQQLAGSGAGFDSEAGRVPQGPLGWIAFAWVVATGTAAVALVALVGGGGAGSPPLEVSWRWGSGLTCRLALEGFARVMAVLVPLVAAPVVAYAGRSERGEGLPRLLAWLLVFVGAMELLVLAGDLLTLLVAWELVGVCSWALIGHHCRDGANGRAAAQAFLTTRFGDLGLYLAAAATWAGAGSLDYRALGGLDGVALQVAAAGLLLAAAAKSAQGPFAPWLFSAMAGPTPVSALLHSATMVAAGAYALIRLAPALAGSAGAGAAWLAPAIAGLGIATVWAGGVVAAVQTDLKRALAASTSSQYGLMLVAIGAGATGAAGVHLVAHAAFKSLLFLGAGVALHAAGTGDLDRLRELGPGGPGKDRRLPGGPGLGRAALLFAVGALALAAVPPLGAAWTKERVVAAAFHSVAGPFGTWGGWLGWATLLSGVLTAFYAARLQVLTFGGGRRARAGDPAGGADAGRAPEGGEWLGLGTLAGLTVLLSVLWWPGARALAGRWTGGRIVEGATWELVAGWAGIVAAFALVWALRRRRALLTLGLDGPDGRWRALREGVAAWLGLPALARHAVACPVLALARLLAAFDDRVVDAGIRAAAWAGSAISRLVATWSERGVDGTVEALARATVVFAAGSGRFDDAAVDGAVEGTARATGRAGSASRRLQSGRAPQYYALIAAGALALLALALLGGLG